MTGRVSVIVAAALAVVPGAPLLPMLHPEAVLAAAAATAPAGADSSLPFADPILHYGVEIHANRTFDWQEGDSHLMLLEGDVSVAMGTYGFRADKAVVRIDTEKSLGREIRHFMIYLNHASGLAGRGPVEAEAPQLLVTLSTTGGVTLATDLLRHEAAAKEPLVVAAQGRFSRYLASLRRPALNVPPQGPAISPAEAALREQTRVEIEREAAARAQAAVEKIVQTRPPAGPTALAGTIPTAPTGAIPTKPTGAATPTPPGTEPSEAGQPAALTADERILPGKGLVYFYSDQGAVRPMGTDKKESALILTGHVTVAYQALGSRRGATLTAERAVIFVAGNPMTQLAQKQTEASQINGIYLEDNVVATFGEAPEGDADVRLGHERAAYTLRAPRIYYDLKSNKALVLDAVMYAWSVKQQIPLYLRAEELRQTSAADWEATNARLTSSEFYEPHFAIAAHEVTIHQEADPTQPHGVVQTFQARDTTMDVQGTPIFWWPYLAGDDRETPLREFSPTISNHYGESLRTTWDPFSLAGQKKPDGVEATLDIDYRGVDGPGTGGEVTYKRPDVFGQFDGYTLPHDTGFADIADRNGVHFDGQPRGYELWRNHWDLPDHWELSVEASYVTDPIFLEQYFPGEAADSKPYETSVYAKKQEDDWAFDILARHDLTDFVPQTPALQAEPYTVDRLPEAGYYRDGTSLLGDRLTYFQQTTAGQVQIRPDTDTAGARAFTQAQSELLFGLPLGTTFAQAAASEHVPTGVRGRLDTRHELDAPFKLGIVNVTPYVVGRFTGYDQGFGGFDGDTRQVERLWAMTGARFDTQFSKTYEQVDSPLLNLHRLRHIIEPYADVWAAGSSVESQELPIYDPDVEGIRDDSGAEVGLRNTLETQRGSQGQWRSVNWLVVDTQAIVNNADRSPNDLIDRFIDFRPEDRIGGDHFHADVMCMVSDTLAAIGEVTENINSSSLEQWRVGGTLQNSPVLTSYFNYTDIDVLNTRYVTWGFNYKMTTKYTVGVAHSIDLAHNQSQTIEVTLTRKLPRWRLVFLARYDVLSNEDTFGVVLVPDGMGYHRADDPLAMKALGN